MSSSLSRPRSFAKCRCVEELELDRVCRDGPGRNPGSMLHPTAGLIRSSRSGASGNSGDDHQSAARYAGGC
jgi:hypothetical protein